jgi:hypothetical protein
MIRTAIVGTALFLNLNEHALDQYRHFSTEYAFWFQNQGHAGTTYGKQGSYIKQLLDALALLLVNEPGADTVTACALQKDMSDDEQPSKRATGNTVICSVPKRPGRPAGFLAACRPGPASILKACTKGGPARPGSEAARPARDLKSLHRPA